MFLLILRHGWILSNIFQDSETGEETDSGRKEGYRWTEKENEGLRLGLLKKYMLRGP